MPKDQELVLQLNIEHELSLQNIEPKSIIDLMGMHMAFDKESSAKLNDIANAFGWAIIQRDMPYAHARMDDSETALELCSNNQIEYEVQLLVYLTHAWLAEK